MLPDSLLTESPPQAATPPAVTIAYADPTEPDSDTAGEQARDTAWRTGDQFEWQGQKLHPFAIDREGDWRAHRAALGAPNLERAFGEAFLADACRILYFCAHDPTDWLPRLHDPIALELRIRRWAAEHIPAGQQSDATVLAIRIFNSAYRTRAVPRDTSSSAGE